MRMRLLLLLALAAMSLAAQERFWRNTVTVGMGAGHPQGDLRGLYENSFGLNLGYGYRFHRNFQADFAFETLFGAARVRDYYRTDFGDLRIKDYQFLLPLGARAILPVAGERVLFYGGGGGAYIRYQERIRQPSDYLRIDCPVCGTRDGWGYYGLLGVSVALDRAKVFRLGVTSRVYRADIHGDAIGPVPGARTRDQWVNVTGEFGLSF